MDSSAQIRFDVALLRKAIRVQQNGAPLELELDDAFVFTEERLGDLRTQRGAP